MPEFRLFLPWRNDGTLIGVMLAHMLSLCGRHVVCLVRRLRILTKMGQIIRHGQRFGQRLDDSPEHILKGTQVVSLHPRDRGLIVRPFVPNQNASRPRAR